MKRSRRVRFAITLGMVLLALTAGGCGRRGRLEPAPDPSAPPPDAVTKTGVHKRPRNPPITAPNEPFLLDPLL